jgi:hypothetical protein
MNGELKAGFGRISLERLQCAGPTERRRISRIIRRRTAQRAQKEAQLLIGMTEKASCPFLP